MLKTFVLLVLIFFSCFTVSFAQKKKTKIFVLSALHQLHEQTKFYSFEALSQIIEKQKPDVLAVELTPSDLQTRKEQKTKQEYQRSVFPLIDKHKYTVIPLEPVEPKFTQIITLVRESEKELREKSPEKGEAFSAYNRLLFDYFFKTWTSPLEVNSTQTDALLEVKHNYQNELFGTKQVQGWESWNRHFLEVILEAAQKHQGKKIVVLVGVEHSYWLRKELGKNQDVILLKPEQILK
jgi:predicted MPP superfamily phosphohydrolase